jgi:hypothetical protein
MKKRLLIFAAVISMSVGFNACSSDDPVDDTDDNPDYNTGRT